MPYYHPLTGYNLTAPPPRPGTDLTPVFSGVLAPKPFGFSGAPGGGLQTSGMVHPTSPVQRALSPTYLQRSRSYNEQDSVWGELSRFPSMGYSNNRNQANEQPVTQHIGGASSQPRHVRFSSNLEKVFPIDESQSNYFEADRDDRRNSEYDSSQQTAESASSLQTERMPRNQNKGYYGHTDRHQVNSNTAMFESGKSFDPTSLMVSGGHLNWGSGGIPYRRSSSTTNYSVAGDPSIKPRRPGAELCSPVQGSIFIDPKRPSANSPSVLAAASGATSSATGKTSFLRHNQFPTETQPWSREAEDISSSWTGREFNHNINRGANYSPRMPSPQTQSDEQSWQQLAELDLNDMERSRFIRNVFNMSRDSRLMSKAFAALNPFQQSVAAAVAAESSPSGEHLGQDRWGTSRRAEYENNFSSPSTPPAHQSLRSAPETKYSPAQNKLHGMQNSYENAKMSPSIKASNFEPSSSVAISTQNRYNAGLNSPAETQQFYRRDSKTAQERSSSSTIATERDMFPVTPRMLLDQKLPRRVSPINRSPSPEFQPSDITARSIEEQFEKQYGSGVERYNLPNWHTRLSSLSIKTDTKDHYSSPSASLDHSNTGTPKQSGSSLPQPYPSLVIGTGVRFPNNPKLSPKGGKGKALGQFLQETEGIVPTKVQGSADEQVTPQPQLGSPLKSSGTKKSDVKSAKQGGLECDEQVLEQLKAFDDTILHNSLSKLQTISNRLSPEVAQIVSNVTAAFNAQRAFLAYAICNTKPESDEELTKLLQPCSVEIEKVQTYRDTQRLSSCFNHLSAVSESITALAWVAVPSQSATFIKEMIDAAQFYTNRIRMEHKDVNLEHIEWVDAWLDVLKSLQTYVQTYYSTGFTWNTAQGKVGSGGISNTNSNTTSRIGFKKTEETKLSPLKKPNTSGVPPPPPPPPPPERSALPETRTTPAAAATGPTGQKFGRAVASGSQLNSGQKFGTTQIEKTAEPVESKKETSMGQSRPTQRVPATLRFDSRSPTGGSLARSRNRDKDKNGDAPVITLERGTRWRIENQKSNKHIYVAAETPKQSVYVYNCRDSIIQVKGKANAITMDNCSKTSLVFDSLVSYIESINCERVQIQVLGAVPTITIDKTDGCQVYLSEQSLNAQIVTAKSSEINIMTPTENGEFKENPLPEQYKTVLVDGKLDTSALNHG